MYTVVNYFGTELHFGNVCLRKITLLLETYKNRIGKRYLSNIVKKLLPFAKQTKELCE